MGSHIEFNCSVTLGLPPLNTGYRRTVFDKSWRLQGSTRISSMAIELGELRKLRLLRSVER